MKIAVTYENGEVFQHFGHTEQFKLYTVQGKEVQHAELVSTNGSGHGALAGLLQEYAVDALICGGIGGGAREALGNAGIDLYPGVTGNADACVKDFLQGQLHYNADAVCASHSHEHSCGEHGHSCGEDKHGCGGN